MSLVFPDLPPQLRSFFPDFYWAWWNAFKTWLLALEARVTLIDGGVP